MRKVSVGSGEVHGLMCQRLICHACQARFSVLHPGVIAQYPDFVRHEFNVTITRRGAVSTQFLTAISRDCISATPFADIAAREAELARALHTAQEVKYLAALNAAKTVKPFAKQRALEMAAQGGKKAAAAAKVGWCKLNPVGTRVERD